MKREVVESSIIKSVGYNEDKQLLEVEMLETGTVYQYEDVPLEEYFDFMDAKSIEDHYNNIIVNKYQYK